MEQLEYNKDDEVRYLVNNKTGRITGRYQKGRNGELLYQVKFSNAEVPFILASKLEKVEDIESPLDLFQKGIFYNNTDFRRTLYKNRLSGELTNIIYSMDNSSTKFLAHQFIPATKFLESCTQRLLIADEVGLGKTIESMYIWEELVARNNAKRLLIVVPAVLKTKWKKDLKDFFNIDAKIVSANNSQVGAEDNLFEHIEKTPDMPITEAFVFIISLEGLRVSDKVFSKLEENEDINTLFDLVIIDEAHYLRNSETRSFKLGEKLRDTAENLLLLSATPIQTGSDNLFNLLNLLAPEDFYNQFIFDQQLQDNIPLVNLTNAIDNNESKDEIAKYLDILISRKDDSYYKEIKENLDLILKQPLKRIQTIEKLKDRYFYNNYITRTRKRDVIENRVERCIETIKFRLTNTEKDFYDKVSKYLKKNNNNKKDTLSIFRLIARQRQMASSIPAALKSWRKNNGEDYEVEDSLFKSERIEENQHFTMPSFDDVNLDELIEVDSKYNSFIKEIKTLIENNSSEKIIVFSFFRDTIQYLYERMLKDDINAIFIMGGINAQEKNDRINAFKNNNINVLISSEVGSEGIDLQFAKYEINYDLPWNPMRIEQRIGRIDRIGQESDKIYIYNAICQNTIEDKILDRLYSRIKVFRESLGDLEDILGKELQNLAVDIFNANDLTDEDIERKTKQFENYIAHTQNTQDRLQTVAGNLSMYQNFVLDNINLAQRNHRFITPSELHNIISDFLGTYYPGSSVKENGFEGCVNIKLSAEARDDFSDYLRVYPSSINTNLRYGTDYVPCRFDRSLSKNAEKRFGRLEDIDINHPLIKWIITKIRNDSDFGKGCSCLYIQSDMNDFKDYIGKYSYYISQWKVNGVKKMNELYFALTKFGSDEIIKGNEAEKILISALNIGESYDSNKINDDDFNMALDALQECIDKTYEQFYIFLDENEKKNENIIKEQEVYINKNVANKLAKINETINNIQTNDTYDDKKKTSIIRMHKGRADKVKNEGEDRLRKLKEKLECSPEFLEVATGILIIGE